MRRTREALEFGIYVSKIKPAFIESGFMGFRALRYTCLNLMNGFMSLSKEFSKPDFANQYFRHEAE